VALRAESWKNLEEFLFFKVDFCLEVLLRQVLVFTLRRKDHDVTKKVQDTCTLITQKKCGFCQPICSFQPREIVGKVHESWVRGMIWPSDMAVKQCIKGHGIQLGQKPWI
jgi:hypothetical protein